MKKAKKSTLIVFALTLSLLICSVFGIVSSANTDTDETGVEIIAQNIVYGDRIQIAFAVNVPLSEAENVEVSYYMVDPSKTAGAELYKATLLDTTKAKNVYKENGVSYPVFVTQGIATKDLVDYVYAVAHEKGAEIPNPTDYVKTSVAEYLYTRLYYDGYATKTPDDGKDYNRRRLYELLIEYGAQAQTVLVNDVATSESQKETLITDYIYVQAEGGSLDESGRKWALYEGKTSLGLVAPEGKTGAWSIITYNDDGSVKTQGLGDTSVTVDKSCKFVFTEGAELKGEKPAIPAGAAVFDFEGEYTQSTKALGEKTVNNIKFTKNEVSVSTSYGGKTNEHGASVGVIEDNNNSHINLTAPTRVHSNDRSHSLRAYYSYGTDDANAYVFEFDLKVDSKFGEVDSNATPIVLYIYDKGGKCQELKMNISGDTLTMSSIKIAKVDTWFTLRLEYSVDEGDLKIYVKNDYGLYEYRGNLGTMSNLNGTVNFVDIGTNCYTDTAVSVHFDNVMLYATNVLYIRNEKVVKLQ